MLERPRRTRKKRKTQQGILRAIEDFRDAGYKNIAAVMEEILSEAHPDGLPVEIELPAGDYGVNPLPKEIFRVEESFVIGRVTMDDNPLTVFDAFADIASRMKDGKLGEDFLNALNAASANFLSSRIYKETIENWPIIGHA